MEVMMNREQRRAARRAKPPRRGAGHIQLPVNMRFSAENETQMMLIPTQCANRLLDGSGDESDWHSAMERINLGRILNTDHFTDGEDAFEAARLEMRACREIGESTGKWSITEAQNAVINTALVLVNQMQTQCSRRELRDALHKMLGINAYNKRADAIKDKLDAGQLPG